MKRSPQTTVLYDQVPCPLHMLSKPDHPHVLSGSNLTHAERNRPLLLLPRRRQPPPFSTTTIHIHIDHQPDLPTTQHPITPPLHNRRQRRKRFLPSRHLRRTLRPRNSNRLDAAPCPPNHPRPSRRDGRHPAREPVRHVSPVHPRVLCAGDVGVYV